MQILKEVLPCVKELAADSSQFVRAALAGLVMELAPILGKQATIDQLLPVFLSLLKDDFPDVRLNIISKLDQVHLQRAVPLPPFSIERPCTEGSFEPHSMAASQPCSLGPFRKSQERQALETRFSSVKMTWCLGHVLLGTLAWGCSSGKVTLKGACMTLLHVSEDSRQLIGKLKIMY